jgi:hypothetical protein
MNKYTSDEIRENSKEICNFLGLRIVDKRAKKNPTFHIPFSTIMWVNDDYTVEVDDLVRASETLFHCNWVWLMELVDAIENVKYTEVTMCKSHSYVSYRGTNSNVQKGKNRLEATYKACLEFVEFYKTRNAKVNYDTSI